MKNTREEDNLLVEVHATLINITVSGNETSPASTEQRTSCSVQGLALTAQALVTWQR